MTEPISKEVVVGCDFGVPASAGQQSKKIIAIEAVRIGEREYSVLPTGRNERLRLSHPPSTSGDWQSRRPGWTLPALTASLALDPAASVAAFDFPFSIPISLLTSKDFAEAVGSEPFHTRATWARFVGDNLQLSFSNSLAKAKLDDLDNFRNWRDKKFWQRRATDEATGGSPPLKHMYQNVFSMTLAGTAMLDVLSRHGMAPALSSAFMPSRGRVSFETYPSAVADRCGFTGSYKRSPEQCLVQAEAYLAANNIVLDFSTPVREFCLTYRTSGSSKSDPDPDGADAFLCLVAAIFFREHKAELCSGSASTALLTQEGCIIAPVRDSSCGTEAVQ